MFIYVITNLVTGKIYIGQHKGNHLKKYLQTKISDALKFRGGKSRLYASMRKHPKEVWSIAPLFEGIETKAELDRLETLLIALYDTRNPDIGYNICKGGEGYTGPFTEEMKAAWRAGNLAYWETRSLVGQVFDRLTVISEVPSRRKGKKLWNCQCSCGKTSKVSTSGLKSGGIRSCGCLISEAATKRVGGTDLMGQRFGKLVVEGDAGRCSHGQKLWKCRCECGCEVTTRTTALVGGRSQSCGCIKRLKNEAIRSEVIRLRVEENKRLSEISKLTGIAAPTCHGWLKDFPFQVRVA